jgi:hypothetical protein
MSNYRLRWKHRETGTPASVAYHASLSRTPSTPAQPSLFSRMNDAAWAVTFGRTRDERESAINTLAGLVQEAHEAGLMVDVWHNRDDLRSNSSKHCITLFVRRPDQSQDEGRRVYLRTVTRATHDHLMPRIRAMFVEERAA